MTKIFERSGPCSDRFETLKLLRTIRGGTKAMRNAGKEYLPAEPGEKDAAYDRRLKRTVLFNGTKKAIQSLSAKPFIRPISVTTEQDEDKELVADLVNSIDGKGKSLNSLSHDIMTEAYWYGSAYFMVDAPADGGRGYAYMLSEEDILDYFFDEDETLVYLRVAEVGFVRDGYGQKKVKKIREWKVEGGKCYWQLSQPEQNNVENYVEVTPWTEFAVGEIPLVPVHADKVKSGDIFCDPPMNDLAWLNLKHYQESSDQSNILHVARVPILFAKGLSGDAEVKIGADNMIIGGDNADMKYVEHSGAAINAGRQSLQDIELQMQIYGYEMMASRGASETATGRSLQANDNNSQVAATALRLQSAIKKVLWLLGKFSLKSNLVCNVDVCSDYGVTISTEELNALSTARQMGDISNEDYLTELKRRGILRSDFDIEENNGRLENELPSEL